MSGTEIFIILVVGIVVVGPKKLPAMMRTAGRWISQVRRMTTEVRATSGIDKIIKEEGLENEIRELSSLTRSNVLSSLVASSVAAEQRATRSIEKSLLPASTRAGTSTAKPAVESAAKVTPLVEPSGAKSTAAAPLAEGAKAGEAASGAVVEAPAAMGGPAPSAEALALIKPASGSLSRSANGPNNDEALRALVAAGAFSIREREYPTIGCDSYDVIPDDIDDPEAYADDPAGTDNPAGAGEAEAAAASVEPAVAASDDDTEPNGSVAGATKSEGPSESKPSSEGLAEGSA